MMKISPLSYERGNFLIKYKKSIDIVFSICYHNISHKYGLKGDLQQVFPGQWLNGVLAYTVLDGELNRIHSLY